MITRFEGDHASEPYNDAEAVDISSTDYAVKSNPARGLIITTTGNVVLQMYGNGESGGLTLTIPVAVPTGHFIELRGYMISKIIKQGTTATVPYVMQ
jgi:hypothetical protein